MSEGIAGSIVADSLAPCTPQRYRDLRSKLILKGIIAHDGDRFVFTMDYLFKTCSEAANVIEGGSRNGYTCRKNTDGESLRDLGFRR